MKKPLIVLGFVFLIAVVLIFVGLYFIPKLKVKAELAGGLGGLLKSDADKVRGPATYTWTSLLPPTSS